MKERLAASERINEKLMAVLQKSDKKKLCGDQFQENKTEMDVMR